MTPSDDVGKARPSRLREAWRVLLAPRATMPQAPAQASELPPRVASVDAVPSAIEGLIAAMPAAAIILDRYGQVVALNAAAQGIAPALRQGEPALIAIRVPELVEAFRHVLATSEPQRIEFFERVPRDRWFEAFVTPIQSASAARERPGLVLLTFNDLTPLRRVEELRADFIANASHELRTPLAALLGFIETLRGSARDDQPAREKFLGIMQAQAERMARLIDDLLSLSRIELNAHLQPVTPVELEPIIRQVADSLQTLSRDRGVAIKITVADPLKVLGDRDELIRAFENLVENALKYGAAGKRVDIVLMRRDGPDGSPEAQVAVRDYGPGIAPQHLPRLTERFYRVDVVDSRTQGGTGLGLALVKHILNRHGGRLTVESVFGNGAAFYVHLPAADVLL